MNGMDAVTGKPLSGDAHLAQSCADILTTPIGTRVMLRDYGSAIFELLDRPWNALTRLLVTAAAAVALARWEPRIALTRISFDETASPSRPIMLLEGHRTDTVGTNTLLSLTIPLRPAS